MNIRLPFLLLAALGLVSFAWANPAFQAERVAASFVLAQGRVPADGEIAEWTAAGPLSAAELLARQQQRIQADPALRRTVLAQAIVDAFGRPPTEAELNAAAAPYTALMQQHIATLAANPDEYAAVIERAYRLVIHRSAFAIEFDYWKARPTLPFTLLVGCIEGWGRRNAPGLMATTGTPSLSINSAYLATVRLSPAIAAEMRHAAGLTMDIAPNLAIAAGHNLLAPGAESVVTDGHMHFAAAGGPNLAPAR